MVECTSSTAAQWCGGAEVVFWLSMQGMRPGSFLIVLQQGTERLARESGELLTKQCRSTIKCRSTIIRLGKELINIQAGVYQSAIGSPLYNG